MPTNATQQGLSLVWGFGAADAPTITAGFYATGADIKFEPEVFTTSENGEGHVDSVTLSNADKRKITASFTGRIDSSYDPTTLPVSFVWNSRRYFVKSASNPRVKGNYPEVSIETESFALVS